MVYIRNEKAKQKMFNTPVLTTNDILSSDWRSTENISVF